MGERDATDADGRTASDMGVFVVGMVSVAASLAAIVVLWARQVTVMGAHWDGYLVSSQCGYGFAFSFDDRADSAYLLPLAVVLGTVGALTALIPPLRSRSAWATVPTATLGLAATAWCSGLGRDGEVVFASNTSAECIGHVESILLPAGMAVGIGVVVAALAWALVRRWSTGSGWWAVATVVVVLAAAVALSVLMAVFAPGHGGYAVAVGRPLRDRGHRRRPRPPAGGWPGGHWHSTAVNEQVAAASFEQVAEELDVLGAPASLIHRCRAAADDERRHAQLCLHLVDVAPIAGDRTTADGTAEAGEAATRLPPVMAPTTDADALGRHPRLHLLRVALEAHLDGVRNEGAAAAAMHRRADELAADADAGPETTAIVRSIACDEERHAALNADIVTWAWRSFRRRSESTRRSPA